MTFLGQLMFILIFNRLFQKQDIFHFYLKRVNRPKLHILNGSLFPNCGNLNFFTHKLCYNTI